MIKKLVDFIKHGVWQEDEDGGHWILRPFRIAIYTVKGIGEHDIVLRSAALTFYTIMSLVPIAALVLGILKGFGLEAALSDYLYDKFPDNIEVVDTIMTFAGNMIAKTRGGIIAAVGVLILLWSVNMMFGNMERTFNNIWEVRQGRSIGRKLTDYITFIFIAPMLLLASNSVWIYIGNMISPFTASWLMDLLLGLGSLVMAWLLFTFIYKVIPNTKVKFKGAMIAGMIAGTAFQVFQLAYFYIQSSVSAYNAVYGSLAAIPLLLVFLQASWLILLVGGELSFAYQNIYRYESERRAANMNFDYKRKVMLASMLVIVRHYINEEGPVNSEDIADELDMPIRTIRDVLYDLGQAGFVVSVHKDGEERLNYYIPARDAHSITIFDIINDVEHTGTPEPESEDKPEMKVISDAINRLKERASGSPYNLKLMDLLAEAGRIASVTPN